MVNRREALFSKLASLGIDTLTLSHPAVFTVEEARALRGSIAGAHCKNLFLKDARGALWLVVCLEDARVNLKALPTKIGSGKISFGKPGLLMEVLGVEPGSVTPFAAMNDEHGLVKIVLDNKMMEHEKLNFHPLENTATTTISGTDLLKFLEAVGHSPMIASIS